MKFIYFKSSFALVQPGMPVLARGYHKGHIDQRGMCLYYVSQRLDLSWDNVKHSIPEKEQAKVKAQFDYMENPIHAVQACIERNRFKK